MISSTVLRLFLVLAVLIVVAWSLRFALLRLCNNEQ